MPFRIRVPQILKESPRAKPRASSAFAPTRRAKADSRVTATTADRNRTAGPMIGIVAAEIVVTTTVDAMTVAMAAFARPLAAAKIREMARARRAAEPLARNAVPAKGPIRMATGPVGKVLTGQIMIGHAATDPPLIDHATTASALIVRAARRANAVPLIAAEIVEAIRTGKAAAETAGPALARERAAESPSGRATVADAAVEASAGPVRVETDPLLRATALAATDRITDRILTGPNLIDPDLIDPGLIDPNLIGPTPIDPDLTAVAPTAATAASVVLSIAHAASSLTGSPLTVNQQGATSVPASHGMQKAVKIVRSGETGKKAVNVGPLAAAEIANQALARVVEQSPSVEAVAEPVVVQSRASARDRVNRRARGQERALAREASANPQGNLLEHGLASPLAKARPRVERVKALGADRLVARREVQRVDRVLVRLDPNAALATRSRTRP